MAMHQLTLPWSDCTPKVAATKKCKTCLETLTLDNFYCPEGGKPVAHCRRCSNARMAAWRATEEGKASSLRTARNYYASERGKAKRKAYYGSAADRESKRKYALSEKGRAMAAKLNSSPAGKRAKTKHTKTEAFRISLKRYQSTDKGRASLARGVHKRRAAMEIVSTLTAEEWAEIRERYGHRCVYCDRTTHKLTMDHLIPLSRGGHHVAPNIVPACRPCNSSKGKKLLCEWRPEFVGRFGPASGGE